MRSAEAEKALRAVGITSLLHQCRSKGEKKAVLANISTTGHTRNKV